MTEENLRDTIEPRSDQLNFDDVQKTSIIVQVTGVKRGSAEQPVEVEIAGFRPYKPCKSMRRVLIAAWGDKGKDWIGKWMKLYGDPSVKFGGVEVGGIRISHLSHIDGPLSLKLTTTRSKRADYTVQPLEAPKEASRADKCRKYLAEHGKTQAEAEAHIGKELDKATAADFKTIAKWVEEGE